MQVFVEGRGYYVEGRGSKMSAFFCYLKKKETNKTKQNKTKQKKIKEIRRASPGTRTAALLVNSARAVPLRHQANSRDLRQN